MIESETFEYFRIQQKVKAIRSSVNILIEHGFTVVDLEGKILRKNEIGEIEWENVINVPSSLKSKKVLSYFVLDVENTN